MSKYSEADLEEERRLAYVGITRAKKELYISNSVTRMLYGRTQRNEPSRFLREIEPEYIEETRSPVLEQRSRLGGWGSGYGSDTVPGRCVGLLRPHPAGGRAASGHGSGYGSRSGYLNKEYNAPMSNSRGFGSDHASRGKCFVGLWRIRLRFGKQRLRLWLWPSGSAQSAGQTRRRRRDLFAPSGSGIHRPQSIMSRATSWSTRSSGAARC